MGKFDGKKNGMKWQNKYGYVGISMMYDMFIGEGINEEGLSAGIFYFPHYGSLKLYDNKKAKNSINDMEFVKWILGNFKNINELRIALDNINIVSIQEKDRKSLPTGHWRVADKDGNNIVIEIVDKGKVNIYENKVGVLTNSPDYEWQIKNLNNYVNLYSGNATSYNLNGEEIFSFGAGTGMLGLPGDITPPSRFVRAFFMLKSLKYPKDEREGVISAFHVLNNFDIPIGLEYPKNHREYIPKDLLSATQWTVVSSLKDKIFYYKSANDSQIKMIDLNKINFKSIDYKVLPLEHGNNIKEIKI